MRRPDDNPRISVAIIGSGMAGLASGYLLKQDHSQRFDVQVFEMQDKLSLDSASITIPSQDGKGQRVDLPMRAFAGGFYSNLRKMYTHLNIKYISMRFLFPLSKAPSSSAETGSKPYYIHSSNNHRIPPVRPEHLGLVDWIAETIYLLVCFAWYTICCFFIPPYTPPRSPSTDKSKQQPLSESLSEYFHRIRLPTYFVNNYILPQASAMTTCTHDELLNFPANDLIEYATQTYNVPYYVVDGGVNRVQKKLAEGLDIQLNSRVVSIENVGAKVRVSYRLTTDRSSNSNNVVVTHQRDFDHAIMAVTPDVVGAIFQPLRAAMAQVPTTSVETIVHNDTSSLSPLSLSQSRTTRSSKSRLSALQQQRNGRETQVIHIRSSPGGGGITEAIHECSPSVLVTTLPITPVDPAKIIHRTRFTRVLRTPRSKEVINRIFDGPGTTSGGQQWRNGEGNVWLVGGWCWDGMVLLEGCIVSAMRVADGLGVRVPWRG
ncbi:hypothetical protein FQN51_006602 [Onygenales sp. PD_10]|nr:hypothetical protein FQN51_006602 [Onygenales sp. PD_10]